MLHRPGGSDGGIRWRNLHDPPPTGNAEQINPATGLTHTAHTNLPVPLIYVGNKAVKAVNGGKLSDIAPTMLSLMGMEIPQRDDWQAAVHRLE